MKTPQNDGPPGVDDITRETYYRMANEARYRPKSESDAYGRVTVPLSELELKEEAARFVWDFNKEEAENTYWLGCPNYTQRSEFILLLEAARCCCSADADLALDLAEMAVSSLRAQVQGNNGKRSKC